MDAFHLMTQVDTSIVLSFLTLSNKDRTIFMLACKWKAPYILYNTFYFYLTIYSKWNIKF